MEMTTPWTALQESSSSERSSPISGVYAAALANFVAMKTQMMRKPYNSMVEREDLVVEAEILGSQLFAIPARGAPPHVELHDTGRFIILQLTGSPVWTSDATRRVQAAGWKKHRDIHIKETVEIKPHLTRANYMGPPHPSEHGAMHNYVGSTPSPDDRPVMIGTHGPASVRKSWMNMGIPPSREGAVTYSARHYGIPVSNMARSSGKHRASRNGQRIPYTEELAYEKGVQDALTAATAQMENMVSNAAGGMGGGRRRKTRKARKTRRSA